VSGAPAPGYAVRCVAHVHSVHSDGTATVAELREAVRAAGARVLLLTDHDTLAARERREDGWADDVLVVVGHEVSPRGGHLLVFDTEAVIPHAGRDEREILDAVAEAGGFGIAAHPFSTGSAVSTTIGRPHPWATFDHPALAGLEVWSLTTDAAEAWRSPSAALRDLVDPEHVVLRGPPPGHLERWDALARRRRLGGLGGLDAHAPGVRFGGRVRTIMPHARWMAQLQTVLELDAPLTGDNGSDTATVLRALRAGATTIAVPPLGDPLAGRATVSSAPRPGGCGPVAGARVDVEAPSGTLVRVIRDGAAILEADAADGPFWLTAPGLHRVELLRPGPHGGAPVPWLLPSPVRIVSGAGAAGAPSAPGSPAGRLRPLPGSCPPGRSP
jgi:hypothetical protein